MSVTLLSFFLFWFDLFFDPLNYDEKKFLLCCAHVLLSNIDRIHSQHPFQYLHHLLHEKIYIERSIFAYFSFYINYLRFFQNFGTSWLFFSFSLYSFSLLSSIYVFIYCNQEIASSSCHTVLILGCVSSSASYVFSSSNIFSWSTWWTGYILFIPLYIIFFLHQYPFILLLKYFLHHQSWLVCISLLSEYL